MKLINNWYSKYNKLYRNLTILNFIKATVMNKYDNTS